MLTFLLALDVKNGTLVVFRTFFSADSYLFNQCLLASTLTFFSIKFPKAPEAILEAAGGTLTDVIGNHYSYGADVAHLNKSGVIATTKEIDHASIIQKIPDQLKEKLSH